MRQFIAPIALLLAVAACGEVKNFTDAAVGDDVIEVDADTSPDAVATGAVTVTATHHCCTTPGPAAGVDVIVVGPDGTVGEAVQTGADGTATVQVTAGDSVTTILHEGSQHYLTSHLAVEPGDQLRVGGNYVGPVTTRGTMTFDWTEFAGASYYYVTGPCGYNYVSNTPVTTTAVYNFNNDCGTGPFDVAVVAYGGSGIIGWKVLANQAFASGGSLSIGALQNPGSFGVSVAGIPTEVTSLYTVANGRMVGGGEIFGGSYSAAPVGGAVTGSFPWASAGAGIVVQTTFSRDNGYISQHGRESLPSTATAYNRSTVELLPWVAYNFAISFSARAFTWIQSGEQPYDGAAVSLYYFRQTLLFGGGNSYRWTLVVPPGVTNLQFPELPAAYAAHDLQDTDSGYGGVILYDRGDADGFDGFRAVPTWELECPNCSTPSLDVPPMRWSGQVAD